MRTTATNDDELDRGAGRDAVEPIRQVMSGPDAIIVEGDNTIARAESSLRCGGAGEYFANDGSLLGNVATFVSLVSICGRVGAKFF
jgi:hypothetical protein